MKNNALGSVRCFETMLDSATNPRAKSSWRKALANIYDVVLPPDVPFKAGGRSWMVPSGFVHEAYGSPMQMKRDAAFIRAHPIEEISVFRLTEGCLEADYGGPRFP